MFIKKLEYIFAKVLSATICGRCLKFLHTLHLSMPYGEKKIPKKNDINFLLNVDLAYFV